MADRFASQGYSLKKQTRWSNEKTIIELSYRKISWFVSVSYIKICLLATDKSRYFAQPRPIIVNYFSHNIPIFLSPTNWSLPSSKNPHFQNETKCTTFHVKMRFICMRMKIISISKAEHLTSFWYGGLGGTRKWPIHGTVEPPFRRDTRDQGKCPLNRGIPSTEVTDTNIIQWILQSGDNLRTRTDVP